jgi:hypothetical protein
MNTTGHLVPVVQILPEATEWRLMIDMAQRFHKARMFPQLQSPEAFLVVMQKGKELGLPPVMALSNIYLISGKPGLMADAVRALIIRHHGGDALYTVESSEARCEISYKRRDWQHREPCVYTIEDAKRARLITAGGNWEKYPRQMLFARATAEVGRRGFAEVLAGCYTVEELGANVRVLDDGEMVVDAQSRPEELGAAVAVTESGEVVLEDARPAQTQGETDDTSSGPADPQRAEASVVYGRVAARLRTRFGIVSPVLEAGLSMEQVQERIDAITREGTRLAALESAEDSYVAEMRALHEQLCALDPGSETTFRAPATLDDLRAYIAELRTTLAALEAARPVGAAT